MGAESKDPENFYRTKIASGSSTNALFARNRTSRSRFREDRKAPAPAGRDTMAALAEAPGQVCSSREGGLHS